MPTPCARMGIWSSARRRRQEAPIGASRPSIGDCASTGGKGHEPGFHRRAWSEVGSTTAPDPHHPRTQSVLEAALRQAEDATADARRLGERAEDVMRRLPVGVVIVNRDYDVEVLNSAARELLGIHGVAIGQDLIHLVPAGSPRPPCAARSTRCWTGLPRTCPRQSSPARRLPARPRHLRLSCQAESVDRGRAGREGVGADRRCHLPRRRATGQCRRRGRRQADRGRHRLARRWSAWAGPIGSFWSPIGS